MKILPAVLILILLFTPLLLFAPSPEHSMTQYVQTTWSTKNGFTSGDLIDFVQDNRGFFWNSSYNGLIHFGRVGFAGPSKCPHENLPSTSTRILHVDGFETLWINTNGEGIIKLAQGPIITHSIQHGLPGKAIRSIRRNREGNLWVGTTSELAVLKTGTILSRRLISLTTA